MAETKTAADRVRERMRDWVEISGLTQEEFAGQFGRTKEWLQKIFSRANEVRLADIDRIAMAMETTPADLVRDDSQGRYQMELTPTEVRLIQRVRHRPKSMLALEELLQLYPTSPTPKPLAESRSETRSRRDDMENT